jgi:hypothetical protein
MKRLYPVAGTKELDLGRQACTFHVRKGPVILDGIHPDDLDAAFELLWRVYGTGNVWVSYRRMGRNDQYTSLAGPEAS